MTSGTPRPDGKIVIGDGNINLTNVALLLLVAANFKGTVRGTKKYKTPFIPHSPLGQDLCKML